MIEFLTLSPAPLTVNGVFLGGRVARAPLTLSPAPLTVNGVFLGGRVARAPGSPLKAHDDVLG
jgi:hypothetical protein